MITIFVKETFTWQKTKMNAIYLLNRSYPLKVSDKDNITISMKVSLVSSLFTSHSFILNLFLPTERSSATKYTKYIFNPLFFRSNPFTDGILVFLEFQNSKHIKFLKIFVYKYTCPLFCALIILRTLLFHINNSDR